MCSISKMDHCNINLFHVLLQHAERQRVSCFNGANNYCLKTMVHSKWESMREKRISLGIHSLRVQNVECDERHNVELKMDGEKV